MKNSKFCKLNAALFESDKFKDESNTNISQACRKLILNNESCLDFCAHLLQKFEELLNKHDISVEELSRETAISLFVSLHAIEIIGGDSNEL